MTTVTIAHRLTLHGLVDVHRKVEPENAEIFTWWAPWRNLRQRNIGWRLDYVLASTATPYDTLLLATGSSAFMPPIEGLNTDGVFAFRTLDGQDELLIDPDKPWVVSSARMAAAAGNTPFDGQPVQGRALALWKGGVRLVN